MLESITLRFTERTDPIVVPTDGVTIFVGPNNSGKSLALREVEHGLTHGHTAGKIVEAVSVRMPTETELDSDIDLLRKKSPVGLSTGQVYIGRFLPDGQLDSNTLDIESLRDFVKKKTNVPWVITNFYRFFQIRLDGKTRFALTLDRPTGDLLARPQNILAHLFQDDDLRKEVREIIHDAFGVYAVIDPLGGGVLRIRLSDSAPSHNEQSLAKEARDFHTKATHISQASDGVQAFVGIVITVQSGDYRVTLIDEPEAFLHPPLARKLGYQLAKTALKRSGSLLAATHSSDFLMGCLQASPNVRVVRLEYSNQKSKGQIVDSNALRKFFAAPLMRSANVISALFHDGVVVTESDNDRSFYSEIYYRLAEQASGSPSLLFVNAQNKQTIQEILGPLRAFGVPAAAIVDIDILKDGGGTWLGWLRSCGIPQASHGSLGQLRGDLLRLFTQAGVDMKLAGVDGLPAPAERDSVNALFDQLAQYGVFVTRKGELEAWLKHLGIPGKKTDWTIAMLQRLGSDPNSGEYVRPDKGDVWDFLREIIKWVKDPARRGTS